MRLQEQWGIVTVQEKSRRDTEGHGLVDMVGIGWWLD